MQVTSLLTKNNPEPIEKLPKFYIKAPEVDWSKVRVKVKHAFATLVLRMARCWDRTEPGGGMLLVMGIILGVMFTVMPIMATDHAPTLMGGLFLCLWMGLKLSILGELLLYGIWEFCQGCKWLGAWADRTKRQLAYEKEDKERKARGY